MPSIVPKITEVTLMATLRVTLEEMPHRRTVVLAEGPTVPTVTTSEVILARNPKVTPDGSTHERLAAK